VSFFATYVLIFILIIRPQEIWPQLEALHLLDLFTGLAALGVFLDFMTGKLKNAFTPQMPFLLGFLAISYASTVVAEGFAGASIATKRSLIAAIFMIVVVYGTATYERIRKVAILISLTAIFVAAVGIHQGQQEPQCIELDPEDPGASEEGWPDGRECTTAYGCSNGGKPEVDYACERIGLFRTVSVVRRVRWRGQLNDPNELAVFLGAVIPLMLALAAEKKKTWLTGLVVAMIGIFLWCVILTQSRGGQLVIASVMACYFIARFGWKGIIGGAVMALPVILLGGRDDKMAEASSDERVGLLYDGIVIFFQHPVLGVGIDQFMEWMTRRQTAHNAYLLAGAELGLPGFFCWTGIIWTSIKTALTIVRRPETPEYLKPISVGMIVSFIGMAVGIFFLSFTFKQLLFLWFGLAGALYRTMKEKDATFEVKIGLKDYLGMVFFDVALMVAIYVYTRLKPPE
jgi:hypothetical protein